MRVLKFIAAAALIFCAAWLTVCGVEWINDTPAAPDRFINIPSNGLRYIPMEGDTVRCDGGIAYEIDVYEGGGA